MAVPHRAVTVTALTDELARRFARAGWVVIPEALDGATVAEVQARLAHVYPSEAAVRADPAPHRSLTADQFGGLRLWPLNDPLLDLVPFDDRLVSIAEVLLGTADLRLLRAGYQVKYAGTADFEQVLHFDYPNHTLVVPAADDIVGFFLLLSDVTEGLGPTMFVNDDDRGAVTPAATHRTVADSPELYAHEHAAVGAAGDLVAYRSTTLHRGSAITASAGIRLTLGYAYGRPAPWTGYMSFPRLGEDDGLINALVAASPRQRALLGFPPVGSDYWNKETIAAIALRYPGLDASPYERE